MSKFKFRVLIFSFFSNVYYLNVFMECPYGNGTDQVYGIYFFFCLLTVSGKPLFDDILGETWSIGVRVYRHQLLAVLFAMALGVTRGWNECGGGKRIVQSQRSECECPVLCAVGFAIM